MPYIKQVTKKEHKNHIFSNFYKIVSKTMLSGYPDE